MPRTIQDFISKFRITDGSKFKLSDIDPGDTVYFDSKESAEGMLEKGVERLSELQEKLYAQDKWAVLIIIQAMDAAGKDGAIKHVMSGVNPQGCQVYAFKTPSSEDLDHDFLWRTMKCLPERGRIGVFNRSYYEETLVVRVHPELLTKQKIPPELITDDIWKQRFQDIRTFERYLHRNGVLIRKFFLHVSKGEQKKRLLKRLEDPHRNWKFSAADLAEREHWDDYMHAFEDMIQNTSTEDAPWFVVPADRKWFTRLVVGAGIIDALDSLNLEFPKVSPEQQRELARIHAEMEKQD